MGSYPEPGSIQVTYFSGTGGTKMAAECLAQELKKRGRSLEVLELGTSGGVPQPPMAADMLVILFPVYAFNAPAIIDEYIRGLPLARQKLAAVISVSGGGETFPNRACRAHTITGLKRRGYAVVYERMLVMPSNIFARLPDELAFCVLRKLPQIAERIALDICSGVTRRTKPHPQDRIFSSLGALEKAGARAFGRHMKARASCSGCGLCAKACPRGNIRMERDRPVFGADCLMCLRCIYGCPRKALIPGIGKFVLVPGGYDLSSLRRRLAEEAPQEPGEEKIRALTKGWLFKGVGEYLLDKEMTR